MHILEHISQKVIFPLSVFGIDISITNEVLVLFASVIIICGLFFLSILKANIIPNKIQNLAEMYVSTLWEYLEPLVHDKVWLPFFCALFSMILFCNLLGIFPGVIPPTTNINFTGALALMIFILTFVVGIKAHGFAKFFGSFVPSGVPWPILVFIVPIEIVSQLARPFSLAVRLFANLFAGHAVTLTIVAMIFVFKSYFVIPGSIIGAVMISAFEIFVAFIQAFVFMFLSAFYIGSALELEH